MIEEKKSKNYLLIFLLIVFIIFVILYISKEAGYYEYKAHQKNILTEEAITKFEEDISTGKDIKSNDYINITKKDYSNKMSVLGSKTGKVIEKVMLKGIKNTLDIISALFFN